MDYEQTIKEVFYHLLKSHPELAYLTREKEILSEFKDLLGHGGIFYYKRDLTCELAKLCDKYGSDKGALKPHGHPYGWAPHTYTDFYRRLWGHCRSNIKKLFECGVGTNNPDLPSSMTATGKPGASLRVWRDYFPNAQIYGADIDRTILFKETRINTFYIDQLNPLSIRDCWTAINEWNFDIIIDDGLHTFEAGQTLFVHSVERLSPTGIYIIEDVDEKNLIKYRDFFANYYFIVDYICLHRPNNIIGDNALVVIRKPTM